MPGLDGICVGLTTFLDRWEVGRSNDPEVVQAIDSVIESQ